jgi:signal peptidase I
MEPTTTSPPEPPQTPQSADPVAARKRSSPRRSTIAHWLRDVLVSMAVSIFIIIYLYQPVRVEGVSMQPGLQDQERLFINKFAYRLGPIARGDVIVFLYPRDQSKSYIKRVIALPGDRVRIDHGRVYVNGEFVPEPYVPSHYRDTHSMSPMVVPPEYYFVLGDHRDVASDSRDFGPVPRNLIYGKAVFAFWPTDRVGSVK